MNLIKKITHIVLFGLFYLVCSNPLAAETLGTLVVRIDGFTDSDGYAMVAVYNSETAYKERTPRTAEAKIKVVNREASTVLKGLPYGTYAVAMYHDRNANGKMDENAMGIPKEPYGFSNNARGIFGPPTYKKAMFELNLPKKEIRISLN